MSKQDDLELPSIESLGRSIAAARIALNAADENPDPIASRIGMRLADERLEGLKTLIGTMQAKTLADAIVQIDIAVDLVSVLATADDGCDGTEIACAAERLLVSAWPVLAEAAGQSLATAHAANLLNLRRSRFAALEVSA